MDARVGFSVSGNWSVRSNGWGTRQSHVPITGEENKASEWLAIKTIDERRTELYKDLLGLKVANPRNRSRGSRGV